MKKRRSCCLFAWVFTVSALGQAQPSANRVLGDVVKVDVSTGEIVLKTAADEVVASFSADTEFLQVEPGATNLANAKRVAVNDIVPADRVLARGAVSADGKSPLSDPANRHRLSPRLQSVERRNRGKEIRVHDQVLLRSGRARPTLLQGDRRPEHGLAADGADQEDHQEEAEEASAAGPAGSSAEIQSTSTT